MLSLSFSFGGAGVGRQVPTIKTASDPKAQTVTLFFAEALTVGAVKLQLKFEGYINDKLAGLYRSKYTVIFSISFLTGVGPCFLRLCYVRSDVENQIIRRSIAFRTINKWNTTKEKTLLLFVKPSNVATTVSVCVSVRCRPGEKAFTNNE